MLKALILLGISGVLALFFWWNWTTEESVRAKIIADESYITNHAKALYRWNGNRWVEFDRKEGQ